MNALKIVLPLIPASMDLIENEVLKQTSPELDRWVRVGFKAVRAGIAQFVVEFKLDK